MTTLDALSFMNVKRKIESAITAAALLVLASAHQAGAMATPLALRLETNGVYIHNAVTSQTIETSFGTNLSGLAFTGTTTYDFYSPPLQKDVSLASGDQAGGVIYMQSSSHTSANDFSVTGRMQFFDYNPVTGADTLVVDTTASPPKNVNHHQTVHWEIPNALLPANTVIPAGHMIHVAMTIGLVSGSPGNSVQVLYNGPSDHSTVACFPQNRSVQLNWPISSGSIAPPGKLSISTIGDPVVQLSCAGTPGATYLIEATTNFCVPGSWVTVSTNVAGTNGLFQFVDSDATNYTSRFYRAKTP